VNPAPTAELLTAAQIARALGVTARAVKLRIGATATTGTVTVRGQKANAWSFDVLPESLRKDLLALASKRGLPSVTSLLASSVELWKPSVPWHTIATSHREQAEKRRDALAPALEKQHELSGPDLMTMAAALYRQHFGHELSADKLRCLMDRATKRDGGQFQFHRADLYLDEAAFKTVTSSPVVADVPAVAHDEMNHQVKQIADKSHPTLEDRNHLLHAAFVHFEKLTANNLAIAGAVKSSLVEYLYRTVPGLYQPRTATSEDKSQDRSLLALAALFDRELRAWIARGRKPRVDGRAGKSGRPGYRCEKCEKIILRTACEFRGPEGKGGNVNLAVHKLAINRALCAACLKRLSQRPLSPAMRRRCTPNELQVAHFKGPEFIRALAPTHHCDWSDTAPGDRFVMDDMTTNELSWDEVEGEIICGQAQLLYTEDEFSSMPLPFLMYFGAPNSRTIKKALWHVFTTIGLPHAALYLEGGVFSNRTIVGEKRGREALRFLELEAGLNPLFRFDVCNEADLSRLRGHELGLRDPALGLKIQHARNPQGKSVERTFFEIQKSTSSFPGFAGFQQRYEKSRAMQDFDRRVAAGKEHPGNEYLHLSDLRKNYERVCLEYMRRPINGRRHRGRCPLDVWKEAVLRRPLRKLPEEIEALFALRRTRLTVRSSGICIPGTYEDDFYFNEHTGAVTGQKVSVHVNCDIPDFIFMEHPQTRKLLKVERVLTKRRTATSEEIAKSNAARRAHINGALGEIGNVNSPVTSWIERSNSYTPEDKERGLIIAIETARHKSASAKTKREVEHVRRVAGTFGSQLPAKPRNIRLQQDANELEREGNAEIEKLQKDSQP
jgi:hypothetical protein